MPPPEGEIFFKYEKIPLDLVGWNLIIIKERVTFIINITEEKFVGAASLFL